VASTRDSRLFSWGKGTRGQLGRCSSTINPPKQVHLNLKCLEGFDVVWLAVSHSNVLVVVSGSEVEKIK